MQSYQNVSNSQPFKDSLYIFNSCKRFCKVIKMLAIHNHYCYVLHVCNVANAFAKLSKCQQFTTIILKTISNIMLQTLLQSYQNVSNSQPLLLCFTRVQCCKRFCKVIKMLAIHNKRQRNALAGAVANAYAKLSKCQQFTTITQMQTVIAMLQTLLQSYQNVSNSQLHR